MPRPEDTSGERLQHGLDLSRPASPGLSSGADEDEDARCVLVPRKCDRGAGDAGR